MRKSIWILTGIMADSVVFVIEIPVMIGIHGPLHLLLSSNLGLSEDDYIPLKKNQII